MLGYEQLETARDIAAGCATITCELCVTFKDVCTLYTTLMQAKERAARTAVKHNTTCGWAELPSELLEKLLELTQEAAMWRSESKEWLAFSREDAVLRKVCALDGRPGMMRR